MKQNMRIKMGVLGSALAVFSFGMIAFASSHNNGTQVAVSPVKTKTVIKPAARPAATKTVKMTAYISGAGEDVKTSVTINP